jgi:hypothetical protein
MRNEGFLAPLLFSLLALAPLGCSRAPDPTKEAGALAAPVTETFLYADPAGSVSRAQRVKGPSGAETLHGETVIHTKDFHAVVVEDAALDATGALVWAEIAVARTPGVPPHQRARFDRTRGTVRLESYGATAEFSVPSDAPWAYLPLPDAAWHAVSTPVSGWIALRASTAPWVRLIRAGEFTSDLVPRDQIAVATEVGTTVVLGCDGVDAGAGFIDRVRLAGLGVNLTRAAGEGKDKEQASARAAGAERPAHPRSSFGAKGQAWASRRP